MGDLVSRLIMGGTQDYYMAYMRLLTYLLSLPDPPSMNLLKS